MKEELTSITTFMEKHNYSSKVLLDQDREVARQYEVTGIPLSILIDREGRVVHRLRSNADWDSRKIRALVDNLINEEKS